MSDEDSPFMSKEEAEKEKRERAAKKRREYRRRKREEKYENIDGDMEVEQSKLERGHDGTPSTKHGFYRKKLDPKEATLAEELHSRFMEKYSLDDLADDLMLVTAVTNFVKGLRKEPETNPGDKNVRSYQAFYERQFRDFLKELGLSRKERKEEQGNDDVASAIAKLFTKDTNAEEGGGGD